MKSEIGETHIPARHVCYTPLNRKKVCLNKSGVTEPWKYTKFEKKYKNVFFSTPSQPPLNPQKFAQPPLNPHPKYFLIFFSNLVHFQGSVTPDLFKQTFFLFNGV